MTTAAAFRIPTWCVVFEGQSLNVIPISGSAYPYQLMSGRSSSFVLPELTAIIGTPLSTLATTAAIRTYPHADSAPNTMLVIEGGQTDMAFNTAASMYALFKNCAVNAKAAGFSKVVVHTLCPATIFSAGDNTRRKAGNDLLIGNADGAFDAVIDLACDSTLSNPGGAHSGTTYYGSGNLTDFTNTTYYSDGLHWKAAGAQDAATSTAPALTALGAT